MPEIEIRPAISEDIPLLIELEHSYTSEYVWQMDTQQIREGGLQISFRSVRYPRPVKVDYPRPVHALNQDWFDRPCLLVATLAGEPIGYVSGSWNHSSLSQYTATSHDWRRSVMVTDLVVRRRLQRKGIGTALLIASLEWAANPGEVDCREAIVATQPKNHPAISLVKKLGFEFSGYMDRYFPNGDIGLFFTKEL